jgi:hypothetical protein
MASKTEKTETDTTKPEGLAGLASLTPAAILGRAWMEGMAELGSEWTTFVADRIKEDVKTQHALLHCKSVTEAQQVQAAFLQKAIDQYAAETGKLIEMTESITAKLRPNDEPPEEKGS